MASRRSSRGPGDVAGPSSPSQRSNPGQARGRSSALAAEQHRVETEAARALRRAEAAEAKFRALVDSAPDAMVIADGVGRIGLVNQQTEALFGYKREDLLGQPV